MRLCGDGPLPLPADWVRTHRLSGACLVTPSGATAGGLLLAAAPRTAGGPPLTSSWLLRDAAAEQPFCVGLRLVAVLAEWLLRGPLMCLLVLLISSFVL